MEGIQEISTALGHQVKGRWRADEIRHALYRLARGVLTRVREMRRAQAAFHGVAHRERIGQIWSTACLAQVTLVLSEGCDPGAALK